MPIQIKTRARPTSVEIEFPSGGYAYPINLRGARVLVKAFDWTTETLLQQGQGSNQSRMVAAIKRIIQLPEGLSHEDLLTCDYQYALLTSRALSYGETIKMVVTCPSCGHKENLNVAIPDHLYCTRYQADVADATNGLIPFKTPDENEVGLRFPTLRDEMEVDATARSKILAGALKEEDLDTETAKSLFFRHIAKVNGEKPERKELEKWFDTNLHERDAIVGFLEAVRPGVRNEVMVDCEKCKHQYRVPLDIERMFFRHRRGPDVAQLPRGIRLGIPSANVVGAGDDSAGA